MSARFSISLLLVPLFLGYLLVWAGCQLEETPPEEQSFFEVQVTGAIEEQFAGQQALFAPFEDPETGLDGLFLQLVTFEEFQRGVSFTGRFDEVPGEGHYDIILVDEELEEDEEGPFEELRLGEFVGLYVTYYDLEAEMRSYVSTSGILEIDNVTEDVLEGSFDFRARLRGATGTDEEGYDVQVRGNFVATRGEVEV